MLTIRDANEIEIHLREIHAAADPLHMGAIQAKRLRGEIACIREILAKVLVPVATFHGDTRLTRRSRTKAFEKFSKL